MSNQRISSVQKTILCYNIKYDIRCIKDKHIFKYLQGLYV